MEIRSYRRYIYVVILNGETMAAAKVLLGWRKPTLFQCLPRFYLYVSSLQAYMNFGSYHYLEK